MFLEETPEQLALRQELRAVLRRAAHRRGPRRASARSARAASCGARSSGRIGKDGWLGIGWPKEYGGQGRPATDQFIFFDETRRASAPFPFVTVNTVGPTIMRFGTDEQKSYFLPAILAGEVNFAIGYTEPEAGTDLASLQTRAVRDGDEYVVNGAKVFTSGADMADYIWLAVRTNPDAPKHKGISILAMSTDSPGLLVEPHRHRGRRPDHGHLLLRRPRAGRPTGGGRERGLADDHHPAQPRARRPGGVERLRLTALRRGRGVGGGTTTPDGPSVLDLPWVQSDLARCRAELEAMYLLNWRMATALSADTMSPADSSTVKVFGVERSMDIYRRLLGIVGAGGVPLPGLPGAVLAGRLERTARHAQINTFGGGVNEIQREIVAMAGLGMTRAAR